MLLFLGTVVEERCIFDVVINNEGVVLSNSLVGLAVIEVVVVGRVGMWVGLFEGKIVVGVVGAIVLLNVEGVVRYLLQHIGLTVCILGHLYVLAFGCFFKELQRVIFKLCLLNSMKHIKDIIDQNIFVVFDIFLSFSFFTSCWLAKLFIELNLVVVCSWVGTPLLDLLSFLEPSILSMLRGWRLVLFWLEEGNILLKVSSL